MSRMNAQTLSPSQRREYCARLRQLWRDDPRATLDTAVAATGAPKPVAEFIRRQLVMAGVLEPHPSKVPPALAGTLHREVCPSCLLGLMDCQRCNGSGYVLKDPYDPRTSGEQRDETLTPGDRTRALEAQLIVHVTMYESILAIAKRWGWVPPLEAEKAGNEPLPLIAFLNRRLEVAAAVIAKERA